MNPEVPALARRDEDQLRLLCVLFRVYGYLNVVLSVLTPIVVSFILSLPIHPSTTNASGLTPEMYSFVWIAVGVVSFLTSAVSAVTAFLAANWIQNRQKWTGILVCSAIVCIGSILGIALGVFSLIVHCRPYVKGLYPKAEFFAEKR